jgi:spore germination cell wall hydrolase CwlJ-like protein
VPRVRADFDSAQASTIDGAAPSPRPQSVAPALPPTDASPAPQRTEPPPTDASEQPAPQRTEPTNASLAPEDADFGPLKPFVPEAAEQWLEGGDSASPRIARIYFGTAPLGGTPAALEPWAAGKAPIFDTHEPEAPFANMAMPFKPPRNETIAPKGEVTGVEYRPKSPAERLGLAGAARAKHEKCLADAVYFEARGEPIRGQMAVAQVVINRVFSGYYPHNICGVVYQNAHRRFHCQFTFACDGLPERVSEPVAWERAKHIARDALDGNFWLNDVGKATHYHARWVHPWWVHEMRRLDRIGVHTFYRPRNWGDGSNSPIWGDAEAPATVAKTL